MKSIRLNFLLGIAAIACALLPGISNAADGPQMTIGIVGSGRLGGTIASLWGLIPRSLILPYRFRKLV